MEKKKLDQGLKTSMTQERVRRLESIGFAWAQPKGQVSWNKRYNELVAYKKEVRVQQAILDTSFVFLPCILTVAFVRLFGPFWVQTGHW